MIVPLVFDVDGCENESFGVGYSHRVVCAASRRSPGFVTVEISFPVCECLQVNRLLTDLAIDLFVLRCFR